MVYRTLRLTSHHSDQTHELQQLVRRLVVRGYNQSYLVAIINSAYNRIKNTQHSTPNTKNVLNNNEVCFLHAYYHPKDPKSFQIQQIFQREMIKPPNMYKKLENLLNHRKARLQVNRLIIAYHRAQNLGNLLSCRVIKDNDGPNVSTYLSRN
jgi:hypothetical protein